jgi:hypothetical protein
MLNAMCVCVGNEPVGRELLIRLINELLSNYTHSPRIRRLIDNTHIFIVPCMNPDGNTSFFSSLLCLSSFSLLHFSLCFFTANDNVVRFGKDLFSLSLLLSQTKQKQFFICLKCVLLNDAIL